jgi:hypothetical protein
MITAHAQSRSIPYGTVGNRTAAIDFWVTPVAVSDSPNEDTIMKIRLYDSKTNQTIHGATFRLTLDRVTPSGDQTLLDNYFSTESGVLLLNLTHPEMPSDGNCMQPQVTGMQNPFISDWLAEPGGLINIRHCSIGTSGGNFTLRIQVLTIDDFRILLSDTTSPQFYERFSLQKNWNIIYSVGQFLYTDKPDQVFKIYYRGVNSTIDRFDFKGGSISARIGNSNNGTLDVMVPRIYPLTNVPGASVQDQLAFFVNGVDTPFDASVITTTDCFDVISLPVNSSSTVGLAWTSYPSEMAFHGDSVPDSCISRTVVPNVPTRHDGSISPLQQLKAGVSPTDVICPQKELAASQYALFLDTHGKPYCVKLSHEALLKQKGWTLASNLTINSTNQVSCQIGQVCSYTLEVGGNTYQIPLKFHGTIQNITFDNASVSKALEISINPLESGTLEIAIPRQLLDSKTPLNRDEHFQVAVDSRVLENFTEYPSSKDSQWSRELGINEMPDKYRILAIPIEAYQSSVTIIGTYQN